MDEGVIGHDMYMDKDDFFCKSEGFEACVRCWDREILSTEKTKTDIAWDGIYELIDDAMEKRDRTVSISYNPEIGLSIFLTPWPDVDDLWEQYQKGGITANDFRAKMGLPMIKNAETFMKKG